MVAKLYAVPVKLPETDYKNYDHKKEQAKEEKYLEDVRQWLKDSGYNDSLTGKLIGFPVADGSAQYMVISEKPLKLVHIAFGDAYQVSAATIRGLTLTDVRRMVQADQFWDEIADDNATFLQKQKVGTILHYNNGFNQYVRQEVVEVNGKKKLKPIALVGDWRQFDLPHRDERGKIYYPYNAKRVVEQELSDRLQISTTYESPKCVKRDKMLDPRNLPVIDLTVPPMTAEQTEAAKLWDLIVLIKETLNTESPDIPRDNPKNPQQRIEAIRQLLK